MKKSQLQNKNMPKKRNVLKNVDWSLFEDSQFPTGTTFKNIKNQRFGNLVVKVFAGKGIDGKYKWHAQCDCGNAVFYINTVYFTKNKGNESCGCFAAQATAKFNKETKTKHGYKGTITYHSWCSMKARCYNKNHDRYHMYGGKGIVVCDRWMDKDNGFINFLTDMGERPSTEYSIERLDNSGNYEPENCKWATATEQTRNRKITIKLTYNGKTQTLMEWAQEVNIRYSTLRERYHYGWTAEQILNIPASFGSKKSYLK